MTYLLILNLLWPLTVQYYYLFQTGAFNTIQRGKKRVSFIFSYIGTISSALHSFLWIWISTCHHFSSAWRGSFNFSYSLGLLVRNSLSFHFTVVFVLPLFLKVIFAICTFLSWQIFFFSALQCYHTVFWPLFWWQIAFVYYIASNVSYLFGF